METLRSFRDRFMEINPVGSGLVSAYYKLSPPIAEFVDAHPALKPAVRIGLVPGVAVSQAAVGTSLVGKAVIAGSLVVLSASAFAWLRRMPGRPRGES